MAVLWVIFIHFLTSHVAVCRTILPQSKYISFNTSSRKVIISYWSTIIVCKTHNSYMELGSWTQVLLLRYPLVVEQCLDSYSPSFLFGLIAAAVEEKVRSFYERVLSE